MKQLKVIPSEIVSVLLTYVIPANYEALTAELTNFTSRVETISSEEKYYELLYSQIELEFDMEEAELLDKLVPLWVQTRGVVFDKERQIDEFYMDFEMLALAYLLDKCVQCADFDAARVEKIIKILKRYDMMVTLWLILCELSGEKVKTGYTF